MSRVLMLVVFGLDISDNRSFAGIVVWLGTVVPIVQSSVCFFSRNGQEVQ